MRWNDLFDDLEGQLEHGLEREDAELRAEEERLRLGRLTVRDRLAAFGAAGVTVTLELLDGSILSATPSTLGRDWMAAELDAAGARSAIVPLSAIAGIGVPRSAVQSGLAADPEGEGRPLSARLGLAFALRDLCRRRTGVRIRCRSGAWDGTIDRVGRDHLDLAVHELGSPRRDSRVVARRIVPFDQVLTVRF